MRINKKERLQTAVDKLEDTDQPSVNERTGA